MSRTHDLVIVAHQDDDLLLMQPDLANTVRRHEPTTIVYVTAGDGGGDRNYAASRIVAVKAAYSWIAAARDWQCRWISLAGHAAQHCDLPSANLALVFLGYPDGGIVGEYPGSLLQLWQGSIDHADTIADHTARYDRTGLIAAVAEVVALTQPTVIRTLEVSAVHGPDHSDHMLVGSLAVLAAAHEDSRAQIISYRGYNVNFEPPNNPDAIYNESSLGMRAYEACQTGCASCGDGVCEQVTLPWYSALLHRHYAVASRLPPLSGVLQTTGRCVIVDGSDVALGDCAQATEVKFAHGGQIRVGDRCLRLTADRRVVAAACRRGPEGYFLLDDEGRLWSGVVPAPGPGLAYNHTMCVVDDGDALRADVCGSVRSQRWVLGRPPSVTLRSQLGITAQGRAIQLADLTGDGWADLCRIENGGLWCAIGDGDGGFAGSVRIDQPAAPLAVDPQSLMFGDLDGDGLIDACGRSPRGILCATAASEYTARLWSPAFGGLQTVALDSMSLAIVDGQVCGSADGGVACAAEGKPAAMRSTWPQAQAALWPADLDGDGAADWCTATDAGPACGLDADRVVTSEGTPWGFAFHTVEGSTAADGMIADQVHGALADISGDGRADLCITVGDSVKCALSQGHAFGPRFPVLTLPPGLAASAVWLGDLDGDGKADVCVDDGVAIRCALVP